nr:reverse transcriptase domain-containing protein [Tanacetum cinerariifolium]
MPSYIGYYDGKGDPDNFLHLFEGAIQMQKWLMPVACHMFTYTLKDSAKIYGGIVRKQVASLIMKISKQSSDHTLANRRSSQRPIWLCITSNRSIKKEKAKSTDIPRGEGKKDKSIAPVEASILMINREDCILTNTVSENMAYKEGITFPPVTRVSNAPIIIEAAVFGRKVGRVYMDSRSTCEIPFDDSENRVKEKEVSDPSNEWKLYTDGASSSDGAGAGLMLIDPAGKEYTYALRFEFETTNNEADYEALLAGLRIA